MRALMLVSLAALAGCGATLSKAAYTGDLARVDELLKQGYDINKRERGFEDCGTPLLAAAFGGQDAVVQELLKRGARLDGFVLYCAAHSGKISTLNVAARAGAKKDEKTMAALAKLSPVNRAEMLGLIDAALARRDGR